MRKKELKQLGKELKELKQDLIKEKSILQQKFVKKYNEKIKLFDSIVNSNQRKGYYIQERYLIKDPNKKTFNAIIYIIEIDKYTNKKSKIKLDYIEIENHPLGTIGNSQTKENIINGFVTLKNTNDITWLESENKLQKERENKLKKIINEGPLKFDD